MDQERWRLIESIFEQSLQREKSTRDEFLRSACHGDAQLKSEVEELIAHHEIVERKSFLEDGLAMHDAPLFETHLDDPYIGTELGPYVIKRRQASGGMGNVYLAVR